MSRTNSKSAMEDKNKTRRSQRRFCFVHDPLKNFRTSAFIATVVAVILLGFTIGLCAKLQDKNSQISSLKDQLAAAQTTAKDAKAAQANATQNYTVSYNGENGQTALSLLKKTHQITTKNYAGIGEMVVSIDGVQPDSSHFWAFYVNGAMASEGASTYQTKAGDKIEWKLEKIQ